VDRTALHWHVAVWDLWFLVWGILLAIATVCYRRQTANPESRDRTGPRTISQPSHNRRSHTSRDHADSDLRCYLAWVPNAAEEYARHVGYADLIREAVDGLTGRTRRADGGPPSSMHAKTWTGFRRMSAGGTASLVGRYSPSAANARSVAADRPTSERFVRRQPRTG
jgi:hypothetical protein